MFVYLDHAQISALDLLLQRDPIGFAEFLEHWLAHGCRLVISRAHLHEIGQCEDDRDVERRLGLLRYFAVWSGAQDENVDWVVIREIRYQTLRRLGDGATTESPPYASLRDELYRPVDHATLESFVRRNRAGWLDEQRVRGQYAGFENRSLRLRQGFRKATKRKEPKWDPEAWRMLPLVRSIAPAASGDPVADRWMSQVAARTPECWSRAERKRQALICIYDLSGLACVERAPEQDLSRLGFFRELGRHWIEPYCRRAGYDPDTVALALDEFDPYDAPAISISLAVERGRKLHEKKYEPGDYVDVDHVLWAAHADLAFVDKRTHGFLLQARKKRETARLLSTHLRVRFERAATLDDVVGRIAALCEERKNSRDRGAEEVA